MNDPHFEAIAKAKAFWIQTYTGKKFYPLEPKVGDLDIVDQAVSLSRICRYNGHLDKHYSVAEHAWRMSVEAERRGYNDTIKKWCLIHDNTEAYLGDMTRPLKAHPAMKPFRDAEDHLSAMIAVWLGLPAEAPKEVYELDRSIYSLEVPELRGVVHPEWKVPPRNPGEWVTPGVVGVGFEAEEARACYLWRFRVLWGSQTAAFSTERISEYACP